MPALPSQRGATTAKSLSLGFFQYSGIASPVHTSYIGRIAGAPHQSLTQLLMKPPPVKACLPVTIAALVITSGSLASASLLISEFQANNYGTLDDEKQGSSDWIEIQNTGDADVNLEGWYLTDDPDRLDRWKFPALKVKKGREIVVFASGDNNHTPLTIFQQGNPIKPTHTNFTLNAPGEYLALVQPDGETIEHQYGPEFPRQIGDISYGIAENGELGYFTTPTPGETNGASNQLGPFIIDVTNITGQPNLETDKEMVITTKVVANAAPIGKVTLFHRFMYGGERSTVMKDDGIAPDETAGDGIYSASFSLTSIFGTQVAQGEMIRWRVEAEDDDSNVLTAPLFLETKKSDRYYGTVTEDPRIATSKLPVLHWFVERLSRAQGTSQELCSMFYLGEFYDNVGVTIHGQSTRGGAFPMKSHNFDFNNSHRFRYYDKEVHGEDWIHGTKHGRAKDIDWLTNWADKSKVRNTMAYEMYRLGGVNCHFTYSIRVELNGDFYSVYDMIEDGDKRWMDRVGLDPNGALYKMYNRLDSVGGGEKKTQKWVDDTKDLAALVSGMKGRSAGKLTYAQDNVDVAQVVNFLAMNSTINNTDYGHKNYYVYSDSFKTEQWHMLPWDVDLSLGRKWTGAKNYFDDPMRTSDNSVEGHIHGNALASFIMSNSTTNDMLYRRLRTLMDKFYGAPGVAPEIDYMERRMNELMDRMDPEGIISDADLDYEKWLPQMNAQKLWDNQDTPREGVARIRDEYIPGRRDYIYGLRKLPKAQKSDLKIEVSEVHNNIGSAKQDEEYFVIQNVSGTIVDLTDWQVSGAVRYTFPAGTVLASGSIFNKDQGKLFIAKNRPAFMRRSESPKAGENLFVQGNYSGNLSSRGETLQLLDPAGNIVHEMAYEGSPSDGQSQLRVTELLYAPTSGGADSPFLGSDFEFIELKNIGDTSLDLTGYAFTDGIDMAFAEGTSLAAGTYGVIVRNRGAFEERFGKDITILGTYSGRLSNSGERLQLRDQFDENILSFAYDQDWSEQADKEGYSLVINDDAGSYEAWDAQEGWSTSAAVNGTPGHANDLGNGSGDPDPGNGDDMTYAIWQTKHFDAAEISNAALSGPDADANADGQSNLLAYALFLDPRSFDNGANLPEVSISEGYLAVSFHRHAKASDLTYTVETSADMVTWTTTEAQVGEAQSLPNDAERVTLRSGNELHAQSTEYVRVAVKLSE